MNDLFYLLAILGVVLVAVFMFSFVKLELKISASRLTLAEEEYKKLQQRKMKNFFLLIATFVLLLFLVLI